MVWFVTYFQYNTKLQFCSCSVTCLFQKFLSCFFLVITFLFMYTFLSRIGGESQERFRGHSFSAIICIHSGISCCILKLKQTTNHITSLFSNNWFFYIYGWSQLQNIFLFHYMQTPRYKANEIAVFNPDTNKWERKTVEVCKSIE